VIVCKFGGTSVADAAAIGRLVGIIRERTAEQPVVVVSALAGVTDALLGLAPGAHAGDGAALRTALANLARRHEITARELPGGGAAIDGILAEPAVAAPPSRVRWGDARPSELDALAGIGELCNSRLVAGRHGGGGTAGRVGGHPADHGDRRSLRAGHAGGTDAREPGTRVPGSALRGGRIPVTQGFIGATADGVPTTLGRGGSTSPRRCSARPPGGAGGDLDRT
jgi:aspartate kinase